MHWYEFKEKQILEWRELQEESLKSWELFYAGKIDVLRNFNLMGAKRPGSVHRFLAQRQKEWQEEWGINGWRGRRLLSAQQAELNTFLEREQSLVALKIPKNAEGD